MNIQCPNPECRVENPANAKFVGNAVLHLHLQIDISK